MCHVLFHSNVDNTSLSFPPNNLDLAPVRPWNFTLSKGLILGTNFADETVKIVKWLAIPTQSAMNSIK